MRHVTMLFAMLLLCGCPGVAMEPGNADPQGVDDQPCTDPVACCPEDKKQCFGDPDKGVVCRCTDLWDCSKAPDKCEQPMQVPGAGEWTCTWTATGYRCTKQGDKDETLGGAGWSCSWGQGSWTCTKAPPNPTNQPGGTATWECIVDNEHDTLHCRKKAPSPPPQPPGSADGGASQPPPPVPPTPDMGTWPWPFPPPADAGAAPDTGPTGPPPPLPPGVKPGGKCVPGTTIWCDGSTYCGWGQMTCLPNGTWPTLAACKELPDGRRPDTPCACYHFYYNPQCCETPDCVVPPGSNGQICPKSAGKLCDYCNPQNPECTEPGAKCIITTSHESFCGQGCSVSNPCPTGYTCKTVIHNKGIASQCFPADGSCYK